MTLYMPNTMRRMAAASHRPAISLNPVWRSIDIHLGISATGPVIIPSTTREPAHPPLDRAGALSRLAALKKRPHRTLLQPAGRYEKPPFKAADSVQLMTGAEGLASVT